MHLAAPATTCAAIITVATPTSRTGALAAWTFPAPSCDDEKAVDRRTAASTACRRHRYSGICLRKWQRSKLALDHSYR